MNNDFVMKPKIDFCFKELMSDEKVRQGFISALLQLPPEEVADTQLLPTLLPLEHKDDKLGILDVLVCLKNGTQLNLEMQLLYFEAWTERTLFYLCKMLTNQLHKGDSYSEIKKCIHVGILDFKLFPDEQKYYSRFHIMEDESQIRYSDKLELHVLELPKLKAYNNPGNELLRWAKFFAAENKEEFQMISQGNEYLETAYDNLIKLSADEQKRLEYELRMKAIRDHNAYMEYAQKQGLKQGIEQGIEQGIKQGRQSGVSETVIELLQEYGNIPSDLKEQILQEQDLEQLKTWLKLAAKVSSIDEFKEKML